MKINHLKITLYSFAILGIFLISAPSFAVTAINFDGPSLLPTARIFIKPSSGNYTAGSTFEAPIYIDTENNNINAINIKLRFDSSKLKVVKSSSGDSIFGIWIESPNYDNVKGTASLVGVIPNGIVTSSGLIATITFKALTTGHANVMLTDYSSANLNDGYGTEVKLIESGASYNFTPATPNSIVETPKDTFPKPIIIYIHDKQESFFLSIYADLFLKYNFPILLLLLLLLLLLEERRKKGKTLNN